VEVKKIPTSQEGNLPQQVNHPRLSPPPTRT